MKWILAVLFYVLAGLSVGCAKTHIPPGGNTSIQNERGCAVRRAALMYLSPKPYGRILVEIDVVEGYEPDQKAISALVEFLQLYCKKPVELAARETIPYEAVNNMSPYTIATQFAQGPPKSSDGKPPAYIYLLFHQNPGGQAMAYALRGYRCAILVDMSAGLKPSELWSLPRTLKHEAGHLLGLCRDKTHGDGVHCDDEKCLMHPRHIVSWSVTKQVLGLPPFKKTCPVLCDKCKREVSIVRDSGQASQIEFVGPVLVRREKGYFVGNLPTHRHLGIGGASVDWGNVIRQAKQRASSLSKEQYTITISYKFNGRAGYLANRHKIENALRDPDPRIVNIAQKLLKKMDAEAAKTPSEK